jgi:hypothetical protein
LAGAVGGDVVDGVGGYAARVDDDVRYEGAVEQGLDVQVEVGLRASNRGAQVGVAVVDVDGGGVVAVDLDDGRGAGGAWLRGGGGLVAPRRKAAGWLVGSRW